MQPETNRQVSFEAIELSLENIDNDQPVTDSNEPEEILETNSVGKPKEVVVASTQVISSARTMPPTDRESLLYTAIFALFGVLMVVSIYAGLVFI